MKKLLNTLYVTTSDSYLSKKGESVNVRVDGATKLCIPIHTLDGIICFGHVMCSPPLMGFCAKHHVSISFLSEYGRFFARVQGPVSGNVLLRREQFRKADNSEYSHLIARAIVAAKITNGRSVLLRATRDNKNSNSVEPLKKSADSLVRLMKKLRTSDCVDTVRGYEGLAARTYFDVFQHLILVDNFEFTFNGRNRRPPLDNVNALLSFLYTIVTHDVVSALEAVGLDPAVGFLHSDRPGRPGLALDLMEEFRPFLADRLALSLINRKQLKKKDFIKTESGAVLMTDKARKTILTAYQTRKREEIIHPFLKEKIAIGLAPHVQSMLLARHIRGEYDGYPPFVWK